MHPNPSFRGADEARNVAFARERGFGVLTAAGEDSPLASHIPFLLSEDGKTLAAHVVRSNPIWRLLRRGTAKALVAVSGADGYMSPDWYGIDDQVPTWNYVAIHLRGEVRLLEEGALGDHLDDLSDFFEARLAPKPIWKKAKMDQEALSRMMRMIAPIEMTVEQVDGTWKLGQNKPDQVRADAADAAETSGIGAELATLAALMRNPPA